MSLSAKTISIVKATAPVVAANKDKITSLMYKKLFQQNPAVKNVFQMSHQDPVGTQPKALANAVVAYALNIENLAALGPTVEMIAQKHVTINVPPEAYPIVGKHLMEAVSEVIGPDVVKGDIHDAWSEAYNFLADIFIVREAEIMQQKAAEGGWVGWKKMKVAKIVRETDVHTSFYFTPTDSDKLAKFLPGQYIGIKLVGIPAVHELHGEYDEHIRNYSLTGCSDSNMYKITVRNITDGIISNHLSSSVKEGDLIDVSVPCGVFVLPEGDGPVVLVGAGVGITPLITMMEQANKQSRKVTFIYKSNNPALFPLKKEVRSMIDQSGELAKGFVFYSNPPEEADSEDSLVQMNQPFSSSSLGEILPEKEDALFFICGPPGFITTAVDSLKELGIKEDKINHEFFGPVES